MLFAWFSRQGKTGSFIFQYEGALRRVILCVRMRQAATFVVYEYFSCEMEFGNIFTDRTLFTEV
jgi:hypothetical protein